MTARRDYALERAAFVRAISSGSMESARRIVTRMSRSSVPVADMFVEVFQPALYEIGDRWERGELSVAQEHVATAITITQIAGLARRPRRVDGPPLAVLAAIEGEEHVVGLQMLAHLLEVDGWEVALVGAATPTSELVAYVVARVPRVVGLSVGLREHVGSLPSVIALLRAAAPGVTIVVGGLAVAGRGDAVREAGADIHATDAASAVAALAAVRETVVS